MLADIDNECEGLGCNRTDFIREAVKDKLEAKRQDQEVIKNTIPQEIPKPKIELIDEEPKAILGLIPEPKPTLEKIEEPKPTLEEILEIKEPKIIIKDVPQDNSNKPPIEMVLYNGKYIPFAKRYNI